MYFARSLLLIIILLMAFLLQACVGNGGYPRHTARVFGYSSWSHISIEVRGADGKPIPNVIFASTHISFVGKKPRADPISKNGLMSLLELNRHHWPDIFLIKPAKNLRPVGISDSSGIVIDYASKQWIQEIQATDPKKKIPYVIYKYGYHPQIVEIPVGTFKKGKISVVLNVDPEIKSPGKIGDELILETLHTMGRADILGLTNSYVGQTVYEEQESTRMHRLTEYVYDGRESTVRQKPVWVKPIRNKLTEKYLVLQQNAKNNHDDSQVCRLMFWRGRLLLFNYLRGGRGFNPEDLDYKTIKEIFLKIKANCKHSPHIQSLRLVDEITWFQHEVNWLRKNKRGNAPLIKSWVTIKKAWIDEAKQIRLAAGARLWPVFYRRIAELYGGLDGYRLLAWFKTQYPWIYNSSDKKAEANAAYSHGIKLKSSYKPQPEALEWLERAAEIGLCSAYLQLGELYEQGRVVKIDTKKALTWYRDALKKKCTIPPYLEEELQQRVGRIVNKKKSIPKIK